MDVEEQLRQEWQLFGRPDGYEAPAEQEERDLSDSRNRRRGQKAQRARLKRNRQQLERERLTAQQQPPMLATSAALPHYLALSAGPLHTSCAYRACACQLHHGGQQ